MGAILPIKEKLAGGIKWEKYLLKQFYGITQPETLLRQQYSIYFSQYLGGMSMAGYINPSLGTTLAIIGILGIIVSVLFFFSARAHVYRETFVAVRGDELRQIPTTLTLLHQRARQLRYRVAKQRY